MSNETPLSPFFNNSLFDNSSDEIKNWDSLIPTMLSSIIKNTNKEESDSLLKSIGQLFAVAFPIPLSTTIEALEEQINKVLIQFNLGQITIEPIGEVALRISNKITLINRTTDNKSSDYHCLCMILEGAYTTWLQQQGGGTSTTFVLEEMDSYTKIVFTYKGKD